MSSAIERIKALDDEKWADELSVTERELRLYQLDDVLLALWEAVQGWEDRTGGDDVYMNMRKALLRLNARAEEVLR